jgi:hypothetical protein
VAFSGCGKVWKSMEIHMEKYHWIARWSSNHVRAVGCFSCCPAMIPGQCSTAISWAATQSLMQHAPALRRFRLQIAMLSECILGLIRSYPDTLPICTRKLKPET